MKALTNLTAAFLIMATVSTASAQPSPSSGMLLGVYAFPNARGLRITSTIPGYSAHGRLFRDDVLLRVSDGLSIYSVRTPRQLEYAKDQIGPGTTAALELFRPRVGVIYMWVTFTPVGGGAGVRAYASEFMTEAERPGAAYLFNNEGAARPGGGNPIVDPVPPLDPAEGVRPGAADLFDDARDPIRPGINRPVVDPARPFDPRSLFD